MLRFPASRVLRLSPPCKCPVVLAAALAPTKNSTRSISTTAPPTQGSGAPPRTTSETTRPTDSNKSGYNSYEAGELNEDRVARWCRRLWEISQQPAGVTADTSPFFPRPTPQHETQVREMDAAAADPMSHGASAAASSSSSLPSDTPLDADGLLLRLRNTIHGDGGRIPGVIVEDMWAVFDALVPPYVQSAVIPAAVLTPAIEEKFFKFISTLNELDFDLQAVVQARKELDKRLEDYLALLRQSDGKEPEVLKASTMTTANAKGQREASRGYTQPLMAAKGEVMRCCFQVRNAGAPLYYTWLRHTASLSDGLRRLMHFRKLAHYFESLCKQRIRGLSAQLRKAEATATDELLQQQSLWRRRQIEVGLVDSALSLLFHDFFAKEYLVMQELTWYATPPCLLDQIMRAEGVHPFVRGLDDMRYRLQPAHHRHLFAFLHPAVVEEPLIAVQVALTRGIARSVDQILGRPTPLADPANQSEAARQFRQDAAASSSSTENKMKGSDVTAASVSDDGDVDTAIFYSINSAQSALRGMDMGNRLIKRVAKEIEGNLNGSRQARHLTPIQTFSTLSPIPLYLKWLAGMVSAMTAKQAAYPASPSQKPSTTEEPTGVFGVRLTAAEEEETYFAPLREAVAGYMLRHPCALTREARAVAAAAAAGAGAADRAAAANIAVLRFLIRLFQTAAADASRAWWSDAAFTTHIEAPLLRSIAVYLCTVKRSDNTRIRDPVGNFHVSNGATIYRLNFLGNTTAQGSRESACVMVNYWYDLPTVSSNVTAYEVSHSVALGEPVKALLGNELL